MNKQNQQALNLLVESLNKKQFPIDEIKEYKDTLIIYLDHYLGNKTYIDGLNLLDDYFNHYLVKTYPLLSTGLIKTHIQCLKRFYTVIYGKDLLTFEQYAKVFDWLVYKGDALLEKYKG